MEFEYIMELSSGEFARCFTNYDQRIEASEIQFGAAKQLTHTSF